MSLAEIAKECSRLMYDLYQRKRETRSGCGNGKKTVW